MKNTEQSFSKTFKKIGGIVTKALAVGAIVGFTKSCIQLGSDLAEVQNVVDVSFPKMSSQVNAFSKNAITQFGLSEKSAKQFMGTFGAMSKSFGFSEESAYEMSKTITGLVGDVASFYNISQDLASVKLKAIWTGETEGLKDLGVVMTQTALQEYALQKGMNKTISEMSEAEKVALRYYFVQDKLAVATGDFARTSDGWANQTRVLSLRFEQLKATLGQGFITLFTPIIKGVNTILAGLQKVADVFTAVINKIFGKQSEQVSSISTEYEALGSSAIDSANDVVSASKKAQKAIMGYDKLNILSNKKDKSSGSGGGGSSVPKIDSISTPSIEDNTSPMTDKIVDKIYKSFTKIKGFIKDAWNSEPIQSFVGAAKSGLNFLEKFTKTIGTSLFNNLSTTWNNVKGNLEQALNNMSDLWTIFWNDVSVGIDTWGPSIIECVDGVFNSIWQDAIDPAIQNIVQVWTDFTDILLKLWQEHGEPLVNNIGEFVDTTIGLFQKIWDKVIEPIITPFLENLSWLWEEHISKMVYAVGDFIGKLVNGALEIYNKFIAPIISYIVDIFSPTWSAVCTTVIGVFSSLFARITDIVSGLLKSFGGIIDFIVGVFTGNWKKAWGGVKDAFSAIIDNLVSVFKLPINLIIDGINGFIAGINKIKLPDWDILGKYAGKGFNISKIPKLAEGAWFKARNPQLAIVGEGKSNEIVAPEPKLDDAIDRGFEKHGVNGGTQKIEMTIYVVYEDGKRIIKKINDTQIQEGKILLEI